MYIYIFFLLFLWLGWVPGPISLFPPDLFFVCKFGRQGSTEAFVKPWALTYSIGYICLMHIE